MTDRVQRALERLRRLTRWRTPPPRWRGVLLLVAATVFVAGIVLSARELELGPGQLRWWPLVVVALAGTPATIALNAAELRAMARVLDPAAVPGWRLSMRTVVLATAANILPLPGGVLVRIHALVAAGASASRATAVNLLSAGVWVGAAVLLAGLAGVGYAPVAAGAGVAIGAAAVVAGGVGARALAVRGGGRAYPQLLAVEVATTLVHGARLWLVLLALDVEVAPTQALVLGVAAPVAAAAGIFPSGLGLAELLTALLAPLVALPAAAGFAATAVARIVGLVATAPLALVLGVRDVRVEEPGPPVPPDAPDPPDAPGPG